MAGIGFELKKLFSNSSIIMKLRANLFSSIVIAGPMIMGAILLLGIKYLAVRAGATLHQQHPFLCAFPFCGGYGLQQPARTHHAVHVRFNIPSPGNRCSRVGTLPVSQ